ncbi:MAG: biotin/lipoyl-containing protein [Nitrosomonadales bacterium]
METDKATMDVPSPAAGIIRELKIRLATKLVRVV